jgi:hypothetical protein
MYTLLNGYIGYVMFGDNCHWLLLLEWMNELLFLLGSEKKV